MVHVVMRSSVAPESMNAFSKAASENFVTGVPANVQHKLIHAPDKNCKIGVDPISDRKFPTFLRSRVTSTILFSYSIAFPIPSVESAGATVTGTVIPEVVRNRSYYKCSIAN